jgi:DNA repair protein RecO (recombination protein O)
MVHSTKGIVFHTLRYSESSVIVKIYTELFGIQSYLVKGVRGPKSKYKPALLQPMTLLDLVVYHKERQSLQSVKEMHLAHPYQSVPFDIRKSSVAIFINELVYKTIREEEPNPALFEFLWGTCTGLDEATGPVSSFPLVFMAQFCHYLGIFPRADYSEQNPVFDLREGHFRPGIPDHPDYLAPETGRVFSDLLVRVQNIVPLYDPIYSETAKWRNSENTTAIQADMRGRLLEVFLAYYRLHLPGFKGVQSHHILHDVLAQ